MGMQEKRDIFLHIEAIQVNRIPGEGDTLIIRSAKQFCFHGGFHVSGTDRIRDSVEEGLFVGLMDYREESGGVVICA
eukprot:4314644-Ditylum_brightwellii.AAC.1